MRYQTLRLKFLDKTLKCSGELIDQIMNMRLLWSSALFSVQEYIFHFVLDKKLETPEP